MPTKRALSDILSFISFVNQLLSTVAAGMAMLLNITQVTSQHRSRHSSLLVRLGALRI